MKPVPTHDPRIQQLIEDLTIPGILEAWLDDEGRLHFQTDTDQYTIAPIGTGTGYGKTHTLPSRSASKAPHTGLTAPGSRPNTATDHPPTGQGHRTGGSVPPQAPAPPPDAGPEPPPNQPTPAVSDQAERSSAGNCQSDPATAGGPGSLDDFTAIDGVGPVTAAKLHDLGFYTYDDLRNWFDTNTSLANVSTHTQEQIKAWLDQRLV